MSSDAVKKRKSKVLRGEGATPEVKRGRVEGEPQVWRNSRIKAGSGHVKLLDYYRLPFLMFGGVMVNIACYF